MVPAPKQPLINCHVHVFNGPDIPPYIGKTFMPWPLYQLISVPLILKICFFWYNSPLSPYKYPYQDWYKRLEPIIYDFKMLLKRSPFLRFWGGVFNFVVAAHAILYFLEFLLATFVKPSGEVQKFCTGIIDYFKDRSLFFDPASVAFKVAVVLFTILFIKSGRQLIIFIAKKAWSFLGMLPERKTVEFIGRYVNIGRFAYYKEQKMIFEKLKNQYPNGSGFIILPMDMYHMAARGKKFPDNYGGQMDQLDKIKQAYPKEAFPFVFIDPRRKSVNGKTFLDFDDGGNGKVILKDCFVRDFIETKKFSGFKIYPALGYYPFDHRLLALWKYAADEGLPITTHCIRGTIFYRGKKEKQWDRHPVFKECHDNGVQEPLLLPEIKNIDFINNFTHPLNYLCLVEERLLRIVVAKADAKTKGLFGYKNEKTKLTSDLSHLKLCFGHYGGDEEWARYFEKDRDNFASQVVRDPAKGIIFLRDAKDISKCYGTLEQIWKTVDWYAIISSMILQYPNLYADISYIIHNDAIFPLLKSTLQNPVLQKRVLFGTDFYVVRNHKSDKEMLADLELALTEQELDLIARDNPRTFLK
jgi:hypothetical protein